MTNILDLVSSDFKTFAQRKFNAVDALVFCELAYICMPDFVPKYDANSKNLSTIPISDLLRAENFPSMFVFGSEKIDDFRKKLLIAVASSPRYRGLRVGEVLERFDDSKVDENSEQQFAGVTFDLTDCYGINSSFDSSFNSSFNSSKSEANLSESASESSSAASNASSSENLLKDSRTLVVAFRGTDNTLVGWKEDFNMAFQCPVPSQESAAEYLSSIAKRASRYSLANKNFLQKSLTNFFTHLFKKRLHANSCETKQNQHSRYYSDNPNLLVVGHSKGGNMATYATMRLDAEDTQLGNLVSKIYSMDGPGFASDVVDSSVFSHVINRVEKIVPQSAFIGLLMDNGTPYKVTAAESIGVIQHFGMCWQVKNGDFDYCNAPSARSVGIAKAVNSWMQDLPFDERKRRIDTVYCALTSLGYPTFDQMAAHWSELLPKILGMAAHLDAKSYDLIRRIVSAAAGVGGK